METVGLGYGPTDNSRVCATASNICLKGLYYKLMSISLLCLHFDLTSLYLRKRALCGQTCLGACPGAVRLYVRDGGACGSEAGAGVWRGGVRPQIL